MGRTGQEVFENGKAQSERLEIVKCTWRGIWEFQGAVGSELKKETKLTRSSAEPIHVPFKKAWWFKFQPQTNRFRIWDHVFNIN